MTIGGGETGIRTLGPPEGVNGFRDRPVRPLRHLSIVIFQALRALLNAWYPLRFGLQKYKLFLNYQEKKCRMRKKMYFCILFQHVAKRVGEGAADVIIIILNNKYYDT